MGRPRYILPTSFTKVAKDYINKKITNTEASKVLNMNRGTFLKYVKQYRESNLLL